MTMHCFSQQDSFLMLSTKLTSSGNEQELYCKVYLFLGLLTPRLQSCSEWVHELQKLLKQLNIS